MNPVTLIKMVISTLNGVEVKGKSNLDSLLGCINVLESVVEVLLAAPADNTAVTSDNKEMPGAGMDNIETQEEVNG